MRGYIKVMLGLFLWLGITACGSIDTRLTVEQLTNARIAVESAEKVDAMNYAGQDMRQAQDAMAIANDAYANQSFERAFEFAKKATIFAKVAKAKTEYMKSDKKRQQLKDELEKVNEQIKTLMQKKQPLDPALPDNNETSPSSAQEADLTPSATMTAVQTPGVEATPNRQEVQP